MKSRVAFNESSQAKAYARHAQAKGRVVFAESSETLAKSSVVFYESSHAEVGAWLFLFRNGHESG